MPLRVLILEDEPLDAELVVRELRRAGFDPDWRPVDTEAGFLAHLDPSLDVILADYSQPTFDVLRALDLLHERGLDIPLLVITGALDDEQAVECLRRGAMDYLLKDRLARLGPAVARAMEERRVREAKRRAEAALRSLFDGVPVGLLRTTPDGQIVDANLALVQILGYPSRDALIAANAASFYVNPEDRRRWQALMGSAGEAQDFEVEFRRYDGSVIWVRNTARTVRGEGGTVLFFEGVSEDITERKRAEEEVRRQRDALYQNEKLAAMGSLLAGVAHELNNPLSVVMGQATLLGMKAGDGPLADKVKKIIDAAKRCGRIVKNFLALARHRPAERERVRLSQIVQDAVELLAYPLRVDTVQVTLDLAPDLPVLWADPHQLHQVLVNLITNAHHAMHATPPPRRLTLTTRFDPAARRVTLEVADTGPGIPPEVQARVFEPFFTTKPVGEGTGLGLPLCQGIIEGHGGTIQVESQPGQGATFRIELPVTAPPAAVPEAPAEGALPPVQGKAILVVDDEPVVAELLADLLSAEGHRVETAANGLVALDKLRGQAYDLILSDVKMPELDGPGLYREVARSHPDIARRFIFVTGDVMSQETGEFLERTGVTSLGKPFALDEVRRAVQRALRATAPQD